MIIAHDGRLQSEMDKRGIAWGVQLDIAQGVTNGLWSWSNITSGMPDKLRGTNAQARKLVHKAILGTHQEPSAMD